MGNKSCPNRQLLTEYLLGRVEGDTASLLDEHISTCDLCIDQMRVLSAEDKLTNAIAANSDYDWPHQSQDEIENISDWLKNMPNPVYSSGEISVIADRDQEQIDAGYVLAPPQEPDEIGRLGRYRILELVGVGGMGLVFRAHDPVLDRIVALKTIKLLYMESRSKRDRFMREARAAAAIENDHIVTVYEVGEDRNLPFLTMQFLRGQTLRRMLNTKPLAVSEVLQIGREIAIGLAAAHKEDLLHRDIKPENIWIEEETGRVKILDFGLSRALGESADLTHSEIVGTPRYMSPEQAQGEQVGPASDLFSLGCVFYHLLTGDVPFAGKSTPDTLISIVQDVPIPLNEVDPDVPDGVCRLVMKLLEKEPSARFASANDVIDAINRIENAAEPNREPVQPQTTDDDVHVDAVHIHEETRPFEPIRRASPSISRRFQIALVAFLVICFGMLIHVATDRGTLVVEAEDSVKVVLKNNQIKLSGVGNKRTYTIRPGATNIKPGDYKIDVTDETGLKFSTEEFSISRLGKQIVSVTLKPKSNGESLQKVSPQKVEEACQFVVGHGRLEHLLRDHTAQVYTVAFSPKGRNAISGGFDHFAILWDLTSGRAIRRLNGHHRGIDAVAYSADGIHLATGSRDCTVRIWDKDKREELHQFKCEAPVKNVMFSPSGSKLLTTYDSKVLLFDVETMAIVWKQDVGDYDVVSTAFSPDGKTIATGNYYSAVHLLDATSGQIARRIDVDTSRISVICVAFSPDNLCINAVAGRGIHQWLVKSGAVGRKAIPLEPSLSFPRAAAFSASGKSALVAHKDDNAVRLYDLETGQETHQIVQAVTSFHGLAYSSDGENALLANASSAIQYIKFKKPN